MNFSFHNFIFFCPLNLSFYSADYELHLRSEVRIYKTQTKTQLLKLFNWTDSIFRSPELSSAQTNLNGFIFLVNWRCSVLVFCSMQFIINIWSWLVHLISTIWENHKSFLSLYWLYWTSPKKLKLLWYISRHFSFEIGRAYLVRSNNYYDCKKYFHV